MREFASMECTECGNRNYRASRNTRVTSKLELKKYCKHCRRHTPHVEKKR